MEDLSKGTMISIKKRDTIFKLKRSSVVSADPTYDGIMFQLQDGLLLQYTDQFMSSEAKQLISNSVNSFPSANLTVDLDNYKRPVVAEPVKE